MEQTRTKNSPVQSINVCSTSSGILSSYIPALTIKIEPNPFSASTTLIIANPQSPILNPQSLSIYDITGRIVKTLYITTPKTTIEKGSMKAGMYFYQLRDREGIKAAGKIVVE